VRATEGFIGVRSKIGIVREIAALTCFVIAFAIVSISRLVPILQQNTQMARSVAAGSVFAMYLY
jgi:hypothetical protein